MYNLSKFENRFIEDQDIICLQETWAMSPIKLLGYLSRFKIIQSLAHKIASKGRGIGGIAILYNGKKFDIIHQEINTNYILLNLRNKLSNENLLIANIYIQPNYDKNELLNDIFEVLERKIESLSHQKVIIVGDLNARIGILQNNSPQLISYSGMSSVRNSQDKTITRRGKTLVELCDSMDLTVLNGCTNGDLNGQLHILVPMAIV